MVTEKTDEKSGLQAGEGGRLRSTDSDSATVTDSDSGFGWLVAGGGFLVSGRSLRLLRDGPAGLREGLRCRRELTATVTATASASATDNGHGIENRYLAVKQPSLSSPGSKKW